MSEAAPVAAPETNAPAVAPAAAPAPAPTSLATGAEVAPSPVATPAPAAPAWPDDWRVKMAGDDKDALKRLERFPDPASIFKSYREAEKRLSSGELKPGKPAADAGDEALAAWRKDNGIPETPEGYFEKLTLPEGMVLGEADKPLADDFAKYAQQADMTPAQMSKAMEWYYKTLDNQMKARAQFDADFQVQTARELGQEWGGDYNRNMNAVRNFLAGQPQDFIDRLQSARTPDGKKLGDDPGFLKWMAGVALEVNPVSTLIPPGANPAKTIAARKAELEGMMADKSSAYWRGPQANDLQAEWRELFNAEQNLQRRNAA